MAFYVVPFGIVPACKGGLVPLSIVLAFKDIDSNGKLLNKMKVPSPTPDQQNRGWGWALAFKVSSLVGASKVQPGLHERKES